MFLNKIENTINIKNYIIYLYENNKQCTLFQIKPILQYKNIIRNNDKFKIYKYRVVVIPHISLLAPYLYATLLIKFDIFLVKLINQV